MGKIKSQKFNKKKLYGIAAKIKMIAFDFDGVFTDNRVLVFEDGREGVFCSRSDGLGIACLAKIGIHMLVISSEVNPVVTYRCRKLGLSCIQGCEDKLTALKLEAQKLKVSLSEVAYMGNDINDIDCLLNVGLPVCVSDAHPRALEVSRYITKAKGGHGAVREFCEFILER